MAFGLKRALISAMCVAGLTAAAQPSSDLVLSHYRLPYTHITVGAHSYVAMIDTGSQISLMISRRLSAEAGFEGHDTGSRVQGYDHRPLPVMAGKLHDVGISGVTFGSVAAAVLGDQVETVSKQVGTAYDGVIGWPLLRKYTVLLDFPHQKMLVSMGSIHRQGAVEIDLPYQEIRGTLEVHGSVNEKPVTFLFDTGAPQCNLDSAIFGLPAGEVRQVQVSLAGKTLSMNCRGRDLALNKPDGVEAVLGEDFMSRFAVLFDVKNKHITLLRN